jgi:predicted nucleotidyltransferase
MKFDFAPARILNSESNLKILRILLRKEISASGRSMAKLTGLSHMTVNRAMREFGEINLVSVKKYGRSNIWEVNKGSYAYEVFMKMMAIIDFKQAALEHLKGTIYRALKGTKTVRAVLFGSISKGLEKDDSDIDLFVLVKRPSDKSSVESTVKKLSDKCWAIYGNTLSPYVIDETQYRDKERKKLIGEIEQGIRII